MTRATAQARSFARQPWYLAALAVALLTFAVVAIRPAGASSGSLQVSSSADRSGAVPLDGATISGSAYVFFVSADNVQRVVFSLDGAQAQVENWTPYDFAGTNDPTATAQAWSTTSTSDGSHSISAAVALVGGGEFTVSATFNVDNAPAAPPSNPAGGTLLVSSSPDRSGAFVLSGATLQGSVYAFLETSASVTRVEFSLDGDFQQTDQAAPYEFAGGAPWSTTAVEDGAHTITALVVVADGDDFTVSAPFTVANDGEPEPSVTATPESESASASATGALLVSHTASRGGASALGAEALSGDAFVFLTSASELREVRFYLDGAFVRTEKLTPYDFGGTASDGSAARWSTARVADGTHVIEAIATTTDGGSFSISASFAVDNDPVEDSTSEVSTTSTESEVSHTIAAFVSDSTDRSGAAVLGTNPLTGKVYVFAVPSETPDRVQFYIDLADQPLHTERITPYDLAGTLQNGDAGAFDLNGLAEGEHSLLVVAEYADGETGSSAVTFVVEHPQVSPDVDYQLVSSSSADRSAAISISGAELEESAYLFVSPADHIESVSFYLDDPARISADRVDESAPFDFVGGSASAAQPLDTELLASGDHALTAVLTRTDGTIIEVHATFSVGGSTLPNGAVLIKTTDNAAQIAGAHDAGTTFVFEAGLHRGVSIKPQSGDVFLGSPGAILSGAKVLSGWNASSGFWYAGGQTSQLTGSGGCRFNEDGTRYDACQYPEQLFVNGQPWWQVTSLDQLSSGRWFFDYAADRVYIGANPAGQLVELSTVANAFKSSASGVTISGLVIEKYASRAQTGAIEGSSGNWWTVSNNELRLNHGYGLRIGNRMQVLNNNVHHNGQLGVGGIGDDVLVEGNEIGYNHTAGFLLDWEAGGTKFVLTDRLVFRNNWVHNNDGRGVWTDIENVNVLVVDNLVEYNSKGGIVHEIGYAAEIRNNVSRYNGHGFSPWVWGAQIVVQNSSDTLVIGNDVTVAASGGGNGISVINQNRGSGTFGPYLSEHVTVTDNIIQHLSVSGKNGAPNGCNQDNTFNNNTYIAPAEWFDYNRFEWCGLSDFEEFQARGQELDGTAVISN